MHGLGNDFIVIDNMNGNIKLTTEQIVFLCDRHKGIGGDAVILVESSDTVDCFMNYINNDGTYAEMCGNGVRCVAKFYKEEILPKNSTQNVLNIDTRAGIKEIKLEKDGTFVVNMGKPNFSSDDFIDKPLELEGFLFNCVSMGNPHAVTFIDDINEFDSRIVGPKVENNLNFPNKINVHVAQEISKKEFKAKIWERACGITLASGTAACAVYAIARKYREAERKITMHLPGGDLILSENEKGEIIMTGPAVSVFSSVIEV